jgi:predicted component of type VI protein secretion system
MATRSRALFARLFERPEEEAHLWQSSVDNVRAAIAALRRALRAILSL